MTTVECVRCFCTGGEEAERSLFPYMDGVEADVVVGQFNVSSTYH